MKFGLMSASSIGSYKNSYFDNENKQWKEEIHEFLELKSIKPIKEEYETKDGYLCRYTVEIDSLNQLTELIKETGRNIIVSEDKITIYDDYMEWVTKLSI